MITDYPLEAASGFGGLLDGMTVSCAGFNPDIQGAVLGEFYKLEEVFFLKFITYLENNWRLFMAFSIFILQPESVE